MLERQQLEVFHSQSDDSVVIQCHGWMGANTCKDLLRVLEAAFERRVQRLRLDLCHVRGIDEAGIDCVLRTAQRCRQVGAILELESGSVVLDALAMSGQQLSA